MDATLVIAGLLVLAFGGILITLHFWGRDESTLHDAVTQEVIVRALTGPVPVHTRLEQPNPQGGEVDKA